MIHYKVVMYFAKSIIYSSIFESVLSDSFFTSPRTVYVVSDSQLEELKRTKNQAELEQIETSRKRLEANYQSRIKVLDEREHEVKEELKALPPSEEKPMKN